MSAFRDGDSYARAEARGRSVRREGSQQRVVTNACIPGGCLPQACLDRSVMNGCDDMCAARDGRRDGGGGATSSPRQARTPSASGPYEAFVVRMFDRLSFGLSFSSSSDPKLLQAHVVFRHAQRLPCEPFFADDVEFWAPKVVGVEDCEGIDVQSALLNAGDGDKAFAEAPGAWRKQMLSIDGWNAALNFGRKLRKKYCGLLGDAPETGLVDARATDTIRTQLSTQGVLEGLCPGKGMAKKVYSATTWAPFGGHRPFDKLMISPGPFARRLMASIKVHGDIRDVLEGQADLEHNERFLRESLKVVHADAPLNFDPETASIFLLGDSLNQRRMHGGPLPPGISAPLAFSLESYFEDAFDRCVSDRNCALEAHGPIVKEIFSTMKYDTTGRKLFLYGAHDLTILSCLRVLCVFPKPYPETLMSLILETYEWYGATYLRVQYAGKDAKIPCVKYETTPKGIEMCLLADVEALVFRD